MSIQLAEWESGECLQRRSGVHTSRPAHARLLANNLLELTHKLSVLTQVPQIQSRHLDWLRERHVWG